LKQRFQSENQMISVRIIIIIIYPERKLHKTE